MDRIWPLYGQVRGPERLFEPQGRVSIQNLTEVTIFCIPYTMLPEKISVGPLSGSHMTLAWVG